MNTDSTMPSSDIRRLVVKQLFDRFNYDIKFHRDEKLTILTAPNGFGKTVILRIIHNFISGNFRFFSHLVFETIEISFSRDIGVRITKSGEDKIADENNSSTASDLLFEPIPLSIKDDSPYTYNLINTRELYHFLERRLPVQRLDHDRWIDSRTDEVLNTDELLAIYRDEIPEHISRPSNVPPWLESLFEQANSHLIETQRLLSLNVDDVPRHTYRARRWRSESVVERDAVDLVNRIKQVVNKYATEAQKLDQTFPRRVIERQTDTVEGESDVLNRLAALGKKRDGLITAGLIGESEGEPISNTDDLSDDNIRKILSIHITDTEEKLNVFKDLNEKVRLFKSIINDHFLFKQIEVNQLDGISAFDTSSTNQIRLSELSSGEQHELVLIYELLFVVNEGAVILIDEPELSLHVAWQRRFISDIKKIQKLRNLQFVIATHSPQIVSDHWDLVQELSYDE